jgi:hypothetical protein
MKREVHAKFWLIAPNLLYQFEQWHTHINAAEICIAAYILKFFII